MGHRGRRCVLLAAGLAALALPGLAADLPGDSVAGEALAREVCAVCHAIDATMPDPGEGAPPFDMVVADPAVTEMSLRVFFQLPHLDMPDLMLDGEETDDIVSYLLQLRQQP